MLKVLDEKLDYVVLEALGDDERGVDIWIGPKNGSREGQQCKGRNGSKEFWDYGTANAKGIFTNWKYNNYENKTYGNHIINNVIFSRPKYIRLLRQYGILVKWFNDPQKGHCQTNGGKMF